MSKDLPDLFDSCYDGDFKKMSPEQFKHNLCRLCLNQGCRNSKGHLSKWNQRMLNQEDLLLKNPRFADLGDPSLRDIRDMDFKNMIQQALAIEISTKKGDWSIPSGEEVGRAAAEMIGMIPAHFKSSPEPQTPLEPPLVKEEAVNDPSVLGKWKVRGDSGTIYEVSQLEGGTWACTCLSRENPCKHARGIAVRLSRLPEEVPSTDRTLAPTVVKPSPITPPKGLNTPVPPGGLMIGGGPPPPTSPVDPWAPPKGPPDRLIPVGGKVSFGSGKK